MQRLRGSTGVAAFALCLVVLTSCGRSAPSKVAATVVAGPATVERPAAVAVGDDGAVYVADAGAGRVQRIDSSGHSTTVASGLGSPAGVAVDRDGLVWIA